MHNIKLTMQKSEPCCEMKLAKKRREAGSKLIDQRYRSDVPGPSLTKLSSEMRVAEKGDDVYLWSLYALKSVCYFTLVTFE